MVVAAAVAGWRRPCGRRRQDFRNFSPDSTAFVFARDHNLYFVEVAKTDTVQITRDGVKDYSFGFRDTTQVSTTAAGLASSRASSRATRASRAAPDRGTRACAPNVTWSPDSKAFSSSRDGPAQGGGAVSGRTCSPSRGPRCSSLQVRDAGRGERARSRSCGSTIARHAKLDAALNVAKWKDQRAARTCTGTRLRAEGATRPPRPAAAQARAVEIDLATSAVKVLLAEAVENATLEGSTRGSNGALREAAAATSSGGRSARAGATTTCTITTATLKRALTSGAWRADAHRRRGLGARRRRGSRGIGREKRARTCTTGTCIA